MLEEELVQRDAVEDCVLLLLVLVVGVLVRDAVPLRDDERVTEPVREGVGHAQGEALWVAIDAVGHMVGEGDWVTELETVLESVCVRDTVGEMEEVTELVGEKEALPEAVPEVQKLSTPESVPDGLGLGVAVPSSDSEGQRVGVEETQGL